MDLMPPNFFVVSDLYENNGTPFAPIAICPIGVGVFSDFMLGARGIRFKYLWLPGSRSFVAKGPILWLGILHHGQVSLWAERLWD